MNHPILGAIAWIIILYLFLRSVIGDYVAFKQRQTLDNASRKYARAANEAIASLYDEEQS